MRLREICCVPERSCVVRDGLAGDPLGQRGALISYGHDMVPGVSVFVRYPRILSLACISIWLSGGDLQRQRAIEGLFMWLWRGRLDAEGKSFYTRGQDLEKRVPSGCLPSYREISNSYVQIIFSDQIGYSLKGLGFLNDDALTQRGIALATAFVRDGVQKELIDWLKGGSISKALKARLGSDRYLPQRLFPDEKQITRESLFSGAESSWRTQVRRIINKWGEGGNKLERAIQGLAESGSEFDDEHRLMVRHISAYEMLRSEAEVAFLPLIKGLLAKPGDAGQPDLDQQTTRRLAMLARRIDPTYPRAHDRAKAMRAACLADNSALELCALAEGLCAVDRASGSATVIDSQRAYGLTEGLDDEAESPEKKSYRSYQIWNLWQLNHHLEQVS